MIEAGGRTFRRVYDEWQAFRKGSICHGTYRIIGNLIELDVLPTFGTMQIDSIKRSDVINLIRRIEKRGAIVTAVKVRQRMGQVFSYAIATGLTEMNGRGYNRDWIERQLAHADTSFIRDVYNHVAYLEQRRTMMQE